MEWAPTNGRGAIVTWLVAHQAFHPAFADEVPYVVAVTELEEGVRLVSGVRDLPRETLRIGFPVEVLLQTCRPTTFFRTFDLAFPVPVPSHEGSEIPVRGRVLPSLERTRAKP